MTASTRADAHEDTTPSEPHGPAHEAARALASARAIAHRLHEPGLRAQHRALLDRTIALADLAVADDAPPDARASGLFTLAHAHAARADDALHGARQLSLSAQRAPTPEACDEGWRRVTSIAEVAVTSGLAAHAAADALTHASPTARRARQAQAAAARAEGFAREAQALVAARNHAYTFHTDGGFSFGEGWYVAAAAALAGVAVQVEPDTDRTAQAERFLRDAGLSDRVQPYRPRPRAVKQTTAIVAACFRDDPAGAQRTLRAAFLGDAAVPPAVAAWADARMAAAPAVAAVLLWVRDGVHHPARNTDPAELSALAALAVDVGVIPVVIGEALRGGLPDGAVDLTRFSRDPVFAHDETRRAQLFLFEHLRRAHGLVGQLGVTTAGMDGPALLGLPTLFLTDAPNVRMGAWVGAVPGYQEIVRDADHLARVRAVLRSWRGAAQPAPATLT